MSKFTVTKTYGTDRGLSCCFRQWRATHSHCQLLHGYSIGVKIVIEADELDQRNWVIDYGGFKPLKDMLEYTFDHTTLIAEDDPELETFSALHEQGLIDLRVLEGVGCEHFAKFIANMMQAIIDQAQEREYFEIAKEDGLIGSYTVGVGVDPGDGDCRERKYDMVRPHSTAKVRSVEVFEHGANSATFEPG